MSLYSGTLQEFIDETCDEIVGKMLGKFSNYSFKEEPDEKEVDSWKTSIPILKLIFSSYLKKEEREISKIFLEYEMPLLSYQRADCIITVGKRIVVLEFKNYPSKNKLDEMQLKGYIDTLKSNLINTQEFEISGYVFYTGKCPDFKEEKKEEEDITTYDNLKKEKSENKVVKKIKELLSEHNSAHDALKNREYKSKLISDLHDPEIRHNQMELYKNEKLLFGYTDNKENEENNNARNVLIVNGSPGSGKTLLAFQSLKRNLKFLKDEVYYITSSEHMKNFLEKEGLIFPYKKGNIIKKISEIDKNTKAKLLICDEVQNASQKEIEKILTNKNIMNIIFFLDMKQTTKKNAVKQLEHLIDIENMKIEKIDLKKSNRFQNCRNDYLHLVDRFFLQEDEEYLNIFTGVENEEYLKIFTKVNEMVKSLESKEEEGNKVRTITSYYKENLKIPFLIGTDENKCNFIYHKNSAPDDEEQRITAYEYSYNNKDSFKSEEVYYLGMPLTVQGFEYDYVGVIFGDDIKFSKDGGWKVESTKNYDTKLQKLENNELLEILKNRYRVLLTRARKGCYIYFEHKETREYFEEVFNIKAQ